MRRILLMSALCLQCLLLPATANAADGGIQIIHIPERTDPDRAFYLHELALGLDDAPAATRAELARISLEELSDTYAREAQQAREPGKRQAGQRDSRRWARAVRQLAQELAAQAQSVTPDSTVQLGIGAEHSVYMTVDGNPVVINGPRPDEQDQLEQRIVERFCDLYNCARLLPDTTPTDKEPAAAPLVATLQWSFSAGSGPVCMSEDGLSIEFDNAGHLGLKRLACARAVAELDALATAINRYRARGTRVEWDRIKIEQHPGRNQHQVTLNSDGDYLQATLPTLYENPELFRKVRPWLISRVNGQPRETRIQHAGVLLLVH